MHLSEGDDEAAHSLLLAGETDVVGGDKHLAQDVHLVEGGPEGAICVPVQFLIFGEAEECPVSLAFGPCVEVPVRWEKEEEEEQERGREREPVELANIYSALTSFSWLCSFKGTNYTVRTERRQGRQTAQPITSCLPLFPASGTIYQPIVLQWPCSQLHSSQG